MGFLHLVLFSGSVFLIRFRYKYGTFEDTELHHDPLLQWNAQLKYRGHHHIGYVVRLGKAPCGMWKAV